MSLFQKSVENKYLNELNSVLIDQKYKAFQNYFGNPLIQENIRNSKEEQFQEGFLRELFVSIFGYTLNPHPDFNLTTELKNIVNSKKADGAILSGVHSPLTNQNSPQETFPIAVIELKGTDTTDLDKIETQAFGYKNHHPKCIYVITSNFEKLRFYIQNAVDHIDFDLFNLDREQFSLMWLCLAKDNLLNGIPLKIKESSLLQEENITKKLYADYSKFREAIYNNLVKNNPETDKLLLFKKTQKLLDRFLFILFAEDRLLLPPNSISEIVKQWTTLKEDLDEYVPLYDRFKKYFGYMNTGYKGKKYDIYAYNGGLFAPDEILDNISIDDEIIHKHTLILSQYDYETDVDVNILGHIFEHSLGEIENVQAEIKGEKIDSQKTKRKKDGIFYTPKYITKYIVENTVGKLCAEKRAELDIIDEEYVKGRKNRKKEIISALDEKLTRYRDWLLNLTILDPACGSGAFLNQALDYLITEHRKIDDLRTQLLGGGLVLSDITTDILEKNIYGVDLNEESVEIAKLSLWLRTAQKGRKLNKLNNNIKCGNSLIDDPEVAGEKAFNWYKEFPNIFREKKKKVWHVTTATHNSRYSQRMFDNHVVRGEAEWFDTEDEIIITETVKEIAISDKLNILEYNICGDHMHILLVCEEEELTKIVGKIKSVTAKIRNRKRGYTETRGHASLSDADTCDTPRTRGHAPLSAREAPLSAREAPLSAREAPLSAGEAPLSENSTPFSAASPRAEKERGNTQRQVWTQKFGKTEVMDQEYLANAIKYIRDNRIKHELPEITEIINLKKEFLCTPNQAFRQEYKGGFDVVIGNPPYGIFIDQKSQEHYNRHFPLTSYKTNLYILFIERMLQVFKKGTIHFIIPKSLLFNSNYEAIRKALILNTEIDEIFTITEKVFEDAEVGSSLLLKFCIKANPNPYNIVRLAVAEKIENFVTNYGLVENKIEQSFFLGVPNCEISVISSNSQLILEKLHAFNHIKDFYTLKNGLNPGNIKHILVSEIKINENYKPIIWGRDISRYNISWSGQYINYDFTLAERISLEDIKSKEGMNKQTRIDFALRTPDLFENRKIVIRKTGDSLIGCIDENKYYFDTLVHGIYLLNEEYSLEALLAIINSKPATLFYRILHDIKGKVFAKISLDNLASFPLPSNLKDYSKELSKNAISLALKTALFINVKDQFLALLSAKFDSLKVNNKLTNWCDLEIRDFLNQLSVSKIKLTLSEEAEWMNYFNDQKEKALSLKSEIEKTEREIDHLVYEMYGLTDDEIKIVEGSV